MSNWHGSCFNHAEARSAGAGFVVENAMQNPLAEYSPELEFLETESLEWPGEAEAGALSESDEMELAAELLEVRDEQELDRFLGKLIGRAARGIRRAVRSPVFKAVGGVLKGVAKSALPLAGGALGTFVGGPLGAQLGSSLASMAGSALGLELEGLSQEDREFEAARRFVRFAGNAVRTAATSRNPDPVASARAAATAAAQRFAPGLLGVAAGRRGPAVQRGRSGRWLRQGRNIVIVNC
jgi:hypothetical protein